VAIFLDDTAGRINQLRLAVQTGDIETIQRVSHALKSSSAYLGADELCQICTDLEESGRSGQIALADDLFAALPLVVQQLRDALNRAGVLKSA
jgi:HPt (histidine-containing phosphotransfer) domain-containing protein